MLNTVLAQFWQGITAPQSQQIVDAYVNTRGPVPAGMSNEDFAEQQMKIDVRTVMLSENHRTERIDRETFERDLKRDFPA